MKTLRIILLGPPASGKGTQSELIARTWNLPATGLGAILRRECELGTKVGLEASEFMSSGRLVPDELAISVIENWLSDIGWDAVRTKGFILDGLPRTLAQANALEEMLDRHECPPTDVLYFEVDAATVEDRVKNRVVCDKCGHVFRIGLHIDANTTVCPSCGGHLTKRTDDHPETLVQRLLEYQEKTAPLVGFYTKLDLLRRIDARLSPDEIFQQIQRAVG